MAAVITAINMTVTNALYQVASTKIGQNTIHCLDRMLKIVEDLNFFSAPEKEQVEARQDCDEFQATKRPLGWVLSIPLLFCFRIIRSVISVLARPFNKNVSAMMAAYYIKNKRRDLRYIKIQGSRMRDDKMAQMQNPWIVRQFINLIIYGPLNFFQFFVTKILGTALPLSTMSSCNLPKKSKRSLKKLKDANPEDITTSELLDMHANDDEDENNAEDDPDFEVKSQDLNAVSEDDDIDDEELDEEGENSEPEEDSAAVKDIGATSTDHENQEEENNQNPVDAHNQQENHENDGGHHQDNNHHHGLQHHDNHHHQHHHQHY